MKSLHIEGRRWFQRGPGNTYHSVRIFKEGTLLVTLPYQYGYGEGYLQTALDWLRDNGHIPDECQRCKASRGTHNSSDHGFLPHYGTQYIREELGGTYSMVDVGRKSDL